VLDVFVDDPLLVCDTVIAPPGGNDVSWALFVWPLPLPAPTPTPSLPFP